MSTQIEQLTKIADAIREKEGTTDPIPASTYAERIKNIKGGNGSSEEQFPLDPYEVRERTRPHDWLEMPIPEDDEVYILMNIPTDGISPLSFAYDASGNLNVEIGTSENGKFISKKTIPSKWANNEFIIEYKEFELNQVLVKLSGNSISYLEFTNYGNKKENMGGNETYLNIIEISAKLPFAKDIKLSSLRAMRYFSLLGENLISNMNNMFVSCESLIAVTDLYTGKATDTGYMFGNCYSLQAIPNIDISNAENTTYMFNHCHTIMALPDLDFSKSTDVGGLFGYCYSLIKVNSINFPKATRVTRVFNQCSSLLEVKEVNIPEATDISGLFLSCSSLGSIGNIYAPKSETRISSIIESCYSLSNLSFNIPEYQWGADDISLRNYNFSREGLIKVFNCLPETSQSSTVNIFGNPGLSDLTDEDRQIATSKGWTLKEDGSW